LTICYVAAALSANFATTRKCQSQAWMKEEEEEATLINRLYYDTTSLNRASNRTFN